jgi:hypothetical protein
MRAVFQGRAAWVPVVVCVLVAVVAIGTRAAAHHSFATYYLEGESIELEGDVVEFQYRNPHSWVFVNAPDSFGRMQTWAAEWTGRAGLERAGVTKDTLRVGDRVRVWAAPNRNPTDTRVHLKRIERPRDHWTWGQQGRREER